MERLSYSTPCMRGISNNVGDSKWRHILLCTWSTYQICCWHQWSAYSTYRKYTEDPKCYDRRSDHKKQKYGIKLRIRQQFSVRMKNRMTYYIVHDICVLMTMCYMHPVRQATWRLSLVWILRLWLPRLVEVTSTAGGSSKNLRGGGKGERWTEQSSTKQ